MAFLRGDDARQFALPLGNGDVVEGRNDGIGRGEVLDDLITEDAVGTYEGDANAGQADRLDDGAGGAPCSATNLVMAFTVDFGSSGADGVASDFSVSVLMTRQYWSVARKRHQAWTERRPPRV